MKKLKAAAALCLPCLLALGALAHVGARAEEQKEAKKEVKKGEDKLAERGKSVYAARCVRCHGADGRGQTTIGQMTEAPDLTDAKWRAGRSRARMVESVTRGRGQMPAFSKKLTKDEIAAAVAYVHTLKR
jgi:cytochrome c oxidase cbb3-type subunit 3